MITDLLFGCQHNLSRVFTIKRRTYKVCLECGREFPYDLEHMRIHTGLKHQANQGKVLLGNARLVESNRG